MRLEGIHHVTCITGDAPGNVDFYTRVLGLRMVKKTVNQDDPTVYHLFYADEAGSPGADITFFEYPGARRGRAGAGMVHTIVVPRRLGGGARLLGGAARRRGHRRPTAARARLRFDDPEGLGLELAVADTPDAPLDRREHPEVPAEHALQGFDSAARVRSATPEASRELLEATLGFAPDRRARLGGRAEQCAAGYYAYDPPPASGAGVPGAGTVHHVAWASNMDEQEALARARPRRAGAHAERDHRPVLVPLDLLPRAERRAVRDRDDGAGLLDRRGSPSTSASR